MAIVFFELAKKQRYLILVFFVVVLLTGIVFWLGFLRKAGPGPIVVPSLIRKIEINLKTFESPILLKMGLYNEIPALEKGVGRSNPFLPALPLPSPLPSPQQ